MDFPGYKWTVGNYADDWKTCVACGVTHPGVTVKHNLMDGYTCDDPLRCIRWMRQSVSAQLGIGSQPNKERP